MLEHRIIVSDADQLVIAEALGVCNVCKVRVALLTVLSDNEWLV